MSTYITYTIDDLDAEIKGERPELQNRSDYLTLRNRGYRRALSEYEDSLITADDTFVRKDTLSAPLSTGTATVNTNIGDVYSIDLPADALKVAGDTILLFQGTAFIANVPRMTLAEIVMGGTGETVYAFYENHGRIIIYVKDATFTAPGTVHCNYHRMLDATQTPTTSPLDIKSRDFSSIVANTISFIISTI